MNVCPTQHRSSEFQRRFGRYETFPWAPKKYRASGTTVYLATFNCQYYMDLDHLPQRQVMSGKWRAADTMTEPVALAIARRQRGHLILLVLLIGGGGWYGRGRWY